MEITQKNSFKVFSKIYKLSVIDVSKLEDFETNSPIIFLEDFAIKFLEEFNAVNDFEKMKDKILMWINILNTFNRSKDKKVIIAYSLVKEVFSSNKKLKKYIIDELD